jgi:hypothetical protein
MNPGQVFQLEGDSATQLLLNDFSLAGLLVTSQQCTQRIAIYQLALNTWSCNIA